MNDTIHLWNDVWMCAEKKDRRRDTAMVIVTMAALLIITSLFYVSSYIQGGGQPRILIRSGVCETHYVAGHLIFDDLAQRL
ncbi:unnamed protein product [Heligmosomoides polygyrus]|uniref:Col_cuticle_N domain-containing protein n=1 Tax=Heligmosomoides polygyrus TaxID=6339 RepID=A0A183FQY1_HELPZ|nr:unnamed protein product [Heligmosomoides polygyrus]